VNLRLIEILLPRTADEAVRALLEDVETLEAWHEPALEGQRIVRLVVRAENVERVLDKVEQRFGHLEGFRVVIQKVEATIPRPTMPGQEPAPPASALLGPKPAMRISREELLAAIDPGTRFTQSFLAFVVLSATVAAAGLLRDSAAVIIGAMVLAPLLTPNMALALATTLGDLEMALRSIRLNVAGVLIAFGMAAALGVVLDLSDAALADPGAVLPGEMAARVEPGLGDFVVALAAGCAGALAFTSGASANLLGVMVAVALLPPLVTGGLLLGAGRPELAGQALLLLAINVISVNLAAVVTFLWRGVRPRTWWETGQARKATRRAVVIWSVLLASLVALVLLTSSV
jgi:uncharacterized hydrophobic protein (TIGR00341 family)